MSALRRQTRLDPPTHDPTLKREEPVKVLARAHQTLIWERTRATHRLRCSLREYFPAALETFDDLAYRDTLAVLAKAATPTEAARLTPGKIRTVLRKAGRQRNIETRADTIAAGLRVEALCAPAAVEAAHGATTRATVAIVVELNVQIAALAGELADHFEQHPDSDIYLSLPGIGVILGARMLGEFGDDPNRYADAKSRKNYAGTSPITRASGKRHVALARFVRNKRLADAIDQAAFCSINASPGARAFYDARRGAGDSHHKAFWDQPRTITQPSDAESHQRGRYLPKRPCCDPVDRSGARRPTRRMGHRPQISVRHLNGTPERDVPH